MYRQYEQLVAMKEKSRAGTQDNVSQEQIRNIETKLDQEKLGRQRAETLVIYIPSFFQVKIKGFDKLEICLS